MPVGRQECKINSNSSFIIYNSSFSLAVLKLKKVRILTHSSNEAEVLRLLQSLELTEFIKKEEEVESVPAELGNVKNVADLESAIKILRQYVKKEPGSIWLTCKEAEEAAEDYDWQDAVQKVHELQQEIPLSENQINSLLMEHEQILPWKRLPISINNLEGSSTTEVILFQSNEKTLGTLKEELKNSNVSFVLNTLESSKPMIPAYLIFSKSDQEEAQKVLENAGITTETLPKNSATVAEEIKKIEKEIVKYREKIIEVKSKLEEISIDLTKLKIVHDFHSARLACEEASSEGEKTERASIFTAWVPFDAIESLKKSLNKISLATGVIEIELKEGETPPVELRNNKLFSMFEAVTRVYGLPKHDEIDPTPILAPFFIVFFGVCLTDVGYGIVMFLLMSAILLFMKLDPGPKKLVRLLRWGGISAIIFGWLFGGFFAMQASQAPDFLLRPEAKAALSAGTAVPDQPFIGQMINPLAGNGLITFLSLAFAAGLLQVMVGIAVNGYWKIKQKKFRDAFQDSFLWLVLIGSGLVYFLLNIPFALNILFVAVGGIIFFGGGVFDHLSNFFRSLFKGKIGQALISVVKAVVAVPSGILKLYDIIGYVSDILSYSRLMALGLSTGIIGFAMNTIAGVMNDLIPVIGIVIAVFVIIFGHALNLALSGLGAFIHSGRLQFVEFFGKFMEGGGRMWQPMDKNFKYVKFLKDKNS